MSTEAEIKDENLVTEEEEVQSTTPDTWLPFIPRIHVQLDLPPWFAAWTLAVVAYVITSTVESCRCR